MSKKTFKIKLILPAIILGFLLVLSIIAIFFALSLLNFINQEKRAILDIKEEIPEIVAQITREEISRNTIQDINDATPQARIAPRIVSPETLIQLKKVGIERYFLSEINLIASRYTSKIHTCLYNGNRPRFPQYIYETWSMLSYPQNPPHEIALVRYSLLPVDNNRFIIDDDCYIKEIDTPADWAYVSKKYGFQKENF